jgi:primosomal protein N' (replication factor Y) (superfamily II helicase)
MSNFSVDTSSTNPSETVLLLAVDVPLPGLFEYRLPADLKVDPKTFIGQMMIVPWGTGLRTAVVFDVTDTPNSAPEKIRTIKELVPGAPVFSAHWRQMVEFAASYYHCGPGELAVPVIPKVMRRPPSTSRRSIEERRAKAAHGAQKGKASASRSAQSPNPELTADQTRVLQAIGSKSGFQTHLLFGVTGSGKTELYLRLIAQQIANGGQVLLLVPEIGLTPQLLKIVESRFPEQTIAVLHSGLTEAKRAAAWLLAADGLADIVLGTRLAVLTPIPNLSAIVVDEEHDASFRQMDNIHYSARDLAIARASMLNIPIVLGSATPSMESWLAAQRGKYQLHRLADRATGSSLPELCVINLRNQTLDAGFSPTAIKALSDNLQAGLQSLVFINRRGYSPVLQCNACGWVSQCDSCSAYRVLHRQNNQRGYRLICHHCTSQRPVPKACPDCGDVDLQPMGRGTQKVEEQLATLLPTARIARLDRDVSNKTGQAESIISAAHAGDVDILVGTQILAKGHDFQRLGLVVVMDADQGIFSSDFRAPERLFANLMQVAGRAGRAKIETGTIEKKAQVLLQTRYPDHPIFASLIAHDFEGFAALTLAEREQNELPPYKFQALLKAQARSIEDVMGFLKTAQTIGQQLSEEQNSEFGEMRLYQPVPMPVARVANFDRAQLLIECASRKVLHAFLNIWLAQLRSTKTRARWQLEVDPLEI